MGVWHFKSLAHKHRIPYAIALKVHDTPAFRNRGRPNPIIP